MFRVERLRLMLGKVVQGHPVADRSGAGIGRQYAGEHLQERTLAGPVFTDQREHFAAVYMKVNPTERDGRAETFMDALHSQALSGWCRHRTNRTTCFRRGWI